MQKPTLPIEFKSDDISSDADYDLYVMIEEHLNKLAEGHSDLTGAAVTLEKPAQGRETDYIVEASVVVYTRPNNISATEKNSNAELALKGALDAIERQVREKRTKMRPNQ